MLLILDRADGELPPYLEWLDAPDAVLFTARSQAELVGTDTDGYATVRYYADYATSARVERDAVALAQTETIDAIVAVDAEDAIRAAGLRDLLGLPGPGRGDAIVQRDLLALRERLERGGIAMPRCAPVERVSDLYWHGHRWGYPLHVRRRRSPGWPVVAELRSEADVVAFTRGGLSPRLESVPSLLVEARGSERWIGIVRHDDKLPELRPACPTPALALARRALALLAAAGDSAWRVELVRADGEWCVDAIAEVRNPRALARAQAGLGARALETVR